MRRAKKPTPHYEIVVAVIAKNGRYLLGRRPTGGLLGGLWEFPGGKVESGETHEAALLREVREELGMGIEVGKAGLPFLDLHPLQFFLDCWPEERPRTLLPQSRDRYRER